ncbi:pentapeptide repeat-containing protein [Clostridium taeniosporum]|uniref:Pentapeptide repeat-containing protein n=1 Tax=Clostridium taeniosporum TaxID=394958 RepID=A0A1D7XKC5_9CLOT|nr:pentapeptide repeat-containing protein [Clostridium taeniosporum]AOR23791.1 pentapeptide repeat-containing protein [Clostridium taeniosporum]
MDKNKKQSTGLNYNKAVKQNKNFMYNDLRRSNCYNCDFTGSNFNFASFRGAHFKDCNFFECTFKSAEFIGSNLKKSKFRRAKLEDTVFEGVNLSGADFRDAKLKNVIFVATDLSNVKNLELNKSSIRIFEEHPIIEMSEELKNSINLALENEKIKKSRLLDNKDGDINTLSVMILLEKFNEKSLISGLKILCDRVDRDFCTLSYIVKAIQTYQKEGII